MFSKLWLRPASLVLLFLCVPLLGCGGGKRAHAKVSGRVKFFDKYLTAGTVAFTTEDGQVGSANIDADGNYEMANAPVGDVTVTVTVPQAMRGPATGGPAKPPGNMAPMRPPGEAGAIGGNAAPTIDPSKIVSVPRKYEDVKTSGLKYTVEKGTNTYNITLSP